MFTRCSRFLHAQFFEALSTGKLFLRIDVCGSWPVLRGVRRKLLLASHHFFPLVIALLFEKRQVPLTHYLSLLPIPFMLQLIFFFFWRNGGSWNLMNWTKLLSLEVVFLFIYLFIYLFKVVFLDHSQVLLSKWDALREKKSLWSNKCGKCCLLNTSWRVIKHLTR